jgi:hypothetical protein
VSKRAVIGLCGLLGLVALGWLASRITLPPASSRQQPEKPPSVTIVKQPVNFSNRTFDPVTPPADMPPLGSGEEAECASDFLSDASVAGESHKEDATHATVTVTHVSVTLHLNITIWVPGDVTQHVVEHEDGHRQIAEYYYGSADKIAQQIAANYIGKQVEITGADLNAESSKALQQMATDITNEYNKELDPSPAQLLYDSITDHSRNDVVAQDAVVSAINNAAIAPTQPAANPGI